jgi:hypothetical protein
VSVADPQLTWASGLPASKTSKLASLRPFRDDPPAGDGNRTRTVSLGTDSLQGRSPRWLRARVMARVPFSDANER